MAGHATGAISSAEILATSQETPRARTCDTSNTPTMPSAVGAFGGWEDEEERSPWASFSSSMGPGAWKEEFEEEKSQPSFGKLEVHGHASHKYFKHIAEVWGTPSTIALIESKQPYKQVVVEAPPPPPPRRDGTAAPAATRGTVMNTRRTDAR